MRQTLFLSLLLAITAQARELRTAYVKFELPENSFCELKAGVWTCQVPGSSDKIQVVGVKFIDPVKSQEFLSKFIPPSPPDTLSTFKGPKLSVFGRESLFEIRLGEVVWLKEERSNERWQFTSFITTTQIKDLKIEVLILVQSAFQNQGKHSKDVERIVSSLGIIVDPLSSFAGELVLSPTGKRKLASQERKKVTLLKLYIKQLCRDQRVWIFCSDDLLSIK